MVETVVELDITSKIITSEEMSHYLRIQVDQAYNIGDYIKYSGGIKKRVAEKMNGLIIYSKISKSEPLEKHIQNILSQIRHTRESLIALKGKIESFIKIGVYLNVDETAYNHSFYLDKNILNELADMNIEFSYDLYIINGN